MPRLVHPAGEREKEETMSEKLKRHLGTFGPGALTTAGVGLGAAGLGAAFLDPSEARSLSSFVDDAHRWNTEVVDPREALRGYITRGSESMRVKPFGLDMIDTVRFGREHIVPDTLKWDPESLVHYQEFQRGPASAYLQRLKEYTIDPNDKYHLDMFEYPAQEIAGAHNRTRGLLRSSEPDARIPDFLLTKNFVDPEHPDYIEGAQQRINQHANNLINEIRAAGATPRKPSARRLFHGLEQATTSLGDQLGFGTDPSKWSYEQQQKVYNTLDPFLKQQDPQLWADKQMADFGVGMAQHGARYLYPTYASKALTLRNALIYGGLASALAAAGYGGYQLWKNYKNKDEDDPKAGEPVLEKKAGVKSQESAADKLQPKRNGPNREFRSGGTPARASNAVLMRGTNVLERYAGGTVSKMAEDLNIRMIASLYEKLAQQQAPLPSQVYDQPALRFVREKMKALQQNTGAQTPTIPPQPQAPPAEPEEPIGQPPQPTMPKTAGEDREPKVDRHGSSPANALRPRSELILFNEEGVYGIDKGDYVLFPGGGVDDGEQPRDAAIREVLEEADRHPINVTSAGTVEALWPEDSGNEFWDDSEFDGERTYFFYGVDAGDAGTNHADYEEFKVIPFNELLTKLDELIGREDQAWAKRNNEERRRLVADAKRMAKTKSNLKPIKQAESRLERLAKRRGETVEDVSRHAQGIPQSLLLEFAKKASSKLAEYGIQVSHEGYDPGYTEEQQGDWDDKVNTDTHSVATEKPETAPGSAASVDGLTSVHDAKQRHSQVKDVSDMKQEKKADVVSLRPVQQHLLFTPDGRMIVRPLADRRFGLPAEGPGKPAPYAADIPFVPSSGVPDEGYHGYSVGLRVGESNEIPEGYEARPAQDVLKDLYASMGLSKNKEYRQLDRARARAILRYLKKRKAKEQEQVAPAAPAMPFQEDTDYGVHAPAY